MTATTTPNPQDFEDAIREYLAPYSQQFNYDAMLHTFLDNTRFHSWAALVDKSHPLQGSRFLSSGCGMGGSLLAYHDAGADMVTGVEVDPLYVRFSGLRIQEIEQARVVAVDPDPPLPFPSASFDVIESMDVIEHVPDPRAYLAELLRVLAPGGLILVVTPNRLWPVEQHLGIVGPPWLPVGMADRIFTGLSRVGWLDEDRRFKYAELHGMRTQNMSLWRLRGLARELGLHLRTLLPSADQPSADHPDPDREDFPLPDEPPRVQAMMRHRVGKFLAPVKTLAITLERLP